MKNYIFTLLISCLILGCKAQTKIDSIALKSRKQADLILEKLDSIPATSKLLYSLNDEDFYVILKNNTTYNEYYINVGNSTSIRKLETKRKNQKLLSDAFNYSKYHTNFITKSPDAKYIRGKNSYFVIKSEAGKRYGEYCLSSLTLPLPIESNLAGYLIRRLSEEISKK